MINLLVIFSVVLLDQGTKFLAEKFLQNDIHVTLIPNFLELVLRKNTGIAFSLFDDYPQILTVLISIVIAYLIYSNVRQGKINPGLACILGGGIGNLIDRLTRGYVVDFINPLFIDFAVFNIADVALNVGVALIIIEQILALRKQ